MGYVGSSIVHISGYSAFPRGVRQSGVQGRLQLYIAFITHSNDIGSYSD